MQEATDAGWEPVPRHDRALVRESYVYVGDNPLNLVDPKTIGEMSWENLGCGFAQGASTTSASVFAGPWLVVIRPVNKCDE
jgi:hypothetical protein